MSGRAYISKLIRGLLLAACCVFGAAACTKARQVGNRPVVNVNGQELKASSFADQLAGRLRHLDALTAKDPIVIQRAKEGLIRDFVISVLTEDWAKANGIFVKAEDLEGEIQKIKSAYPDSLTFDRVLAEQTLSYKDWKDRLTRTLLLRLVSARLNEKVTAPSDEEMRNYYAANKETFERPDQVRIRQVVVTTEADAKVIAEQLKKGKPLAELAEKHSITPEGKRNKGDLGWIEKGVMEGFDAAFSMPVGRRSDIVKSPYGYHIFEVTAKRPAQARPFDQVKDKIRSALIANREQAIFTSWLEGELRKARVLKDDQLISQIRIETKEQ
jgi:parvulin-like peptidyl-prolyl isomerase